MLPQELYDLIVDFCHDHRQALRACSLTSRALRTSSRAHIFRSILIHSGLVLERFCQLLRTSPDVADLVEELRFKSYLHFMRKDPYLWICHAASLPAGRFPRLRVLEFSHVRFNELNVCAPEFMRAFYNNLANYRGIRELRLTSCDFDHLEALNALIARVALPSDGPPKFALSLECVDFQSGAAEGLPRPAAPLDTQLRLASFTGGVNAQSDSIIHWLMSAPGCRTLRAVTLSGVLGLQIIAVGDFLRHLGGTLEELQLGIRLDCGRALVQEVQRIFDLSLNKKLRYLRLRILDHLTDEYLIRWVNILLMQAAQLPLQKVTFEMWMHDPSQLRFAVWDDIEATLSSVPFETVRDVLVIHRGDLDFKIARNALEKRLPALVQRRTLTVRDCSGLWTTRYRNPHSVLTEE